MNDDRFIDLVRAVRAAFEDGKRTAERELADAREQIEMLERQVRAMQRAGRRAS